MLCERFATCSFHKVFKDQLSSREYEFFIRSYCEGASQSRCKRLQYWRERGEEPPAEMNPLGYEIGTLRKIYH